MRDYARFKANEEELQDVETEAGRAVYARPRRKVRRNENETKKRSGRAYMLRRSVKQRTKSHASGKSTRL